MSTVNDTQPVDLQEKCKHAEKLVDFIQKKIRQKCVAEANWFFKKSASDMEKGEREKISKQLSALIEQANKYFHEADTLEKERKLEQAREKYKKVEDIAIDYPGLPEAFRRVDEAIALVRAMKHRAKRRNSEQDKQSVLLTTSSQSGRFHGWFPLIACFSLLLIMVGAGLIYTDNLNLTFTEKDTVNLPINKKIEQPESQKEEKNKATSLQQQTQKYTLSKEDVGKQQDSLKQAEQIASSEIKTALLPAPKKQMSKSVPAGIEKDRQQKLSEQDTGANRKERVVSFADRQLNQKETLYPLPVSQMEKKIVGVSSAEGEFTIRQGIHPSAYITRKFEESMSEKSTPQFQDYVASRLTVDESEQPQQTRSVDKQQEKAPVEITFGRKNSTESVYTVQPGDTLLSISLKVYGTSTKWPAIAKANKDQLANNPDGLRVGMTLAIPTFSKTGNVLLPQGSSTSLPDLDEDGTYTAQPGDSLSKIAQKFFGDARKWKNIYELNNDVLIAPHLLEVGQIIRLKASVPLKETIEFSEPKLEEERPAFLNFGLGDRFGDDQNASDNIDSQ